MKDKAKILIVDDQANNTELLEAYLSPQGYDVIIASSGKKALETLFGGEIDLILLDVMMPEMDGFEVTRLIRENESSRMIPVVLVTALHETEDRIKGIEAGCDDFISKPIDRMELLARVRSLLKIKAYNDLLSNYRKDLESDVAARTEELKKALEKLQESSLETIYRLSMASEYKDEDTGAHIKRMSLYSAAIATRMNLDVNTVRLLLYSSPMHDVGKIGIPDLILLKPGKLDAAEWKIMMQHTNIGAGILNGSEAEFIRMGEQIARGHHEKWDGTGYPDGLKGAEIPLVCRITAIADVFDALTSRRPYKEPFSVEKSISIITEGRGSHFDPDVFDAFIAIKDDILSIKDQFENDKELSFDVSDLKAMVQQYNLDNLHKKPAGAGVEPDKPVL
ncbi:MAG: two-component system response regulator [Spirochaetae bacterium HGW-Spirochaetae-5]|nr:MAG: two-component system response regulator [Spirochaetae bacterium HGW-Spirochaetae-5]